MGFSGKIINALAALALVGSLVSCSVSPTNHAAPHPTGGPAITATYTPSPSPTATATYTPYPTPTMTATPTPIPVQLIFYAFHDYNGNGNPDPGEPPLSGITNSTAGKSCTTGEDGRCSIYLPPGTYNIAVKDPNGRFRYILPSVREVRKISDGIRGVRVQASEKGYTEVLVPLGEGFLTLPFRPGTHILGVYEYFDHDPDLNKYLYWNGLSGFRQERNHVGTDFMVERNGIEVVSPVPGKIVWMDRDPNGGWGVEILTIGGYGIGVIHFSPREGLQEGMFVERGDFLGLVDFRHLPHIHLDVNQHRDSGVYFLDSYRPTLDTCTEYRLIGQGKFESIKAKCPPGLWIVNNQPTYP